MNWVRNSLRFLLVTVGVIMITSLGIDASQYLSGSQSALGILADRVSESGCPEGMSTVAIAGDDFCVDTYEVSPHEDCPVLVIQNSADTITNFNNPECVPVSVSGQKPWTHVAYQQAAQLCAKAGKRLPAPAEWYQAAIGTSEQACTIDSSAPENTGSKSQCIAGSGALDMIGNVWEWQSGEVVDGSWEGRILPDSGYVYNTDMYGVAVDTSANASELFQADYFWTGTNGRKALMRGGFYGSGTDAGLYSIHADVDPIFSGAAIGFRCVL